MRTMLRLSRPARGFVAAVAAVLFLACQGTAVVYARSAVAPGSKPAQGSCHDPGQQSGKTAGINTCQANCQSQLTSSGPLGALAAADLVAITAHADRAIAVFDPAAPARSPLPRFEPPPLTILH